MTTGGVRVLGATRLRVLNSLPRRHQDYFFEVVRTLCTKHIALASRRDPKVDRRSESLELFSEVMAKLLGVAGIDMEQGTQQQFEAELQQTWVAHADPKRDGRVAWLIDEVGGSQALTHRYEDIRRRRHGGKWREDGYRQVQLEPAHVDNLSVDPEDPYHDEDIRQIWRGVLAMAESEFEPSADVSILLHLMANDPDIQAGFGTEWPITQIVNWLNQRHPDSPWNDDRVENAKKRLKNWIVRLKRAHGLDATDLMDLFARRGRAPERLKAPSLRLAHSAPPTNAIASSEIGS